MYQYCYEFAAWMFNGATASVISFFAVVLNVGVLVLALLPIVLLIKFVFKGR